MMRKLMIVDDELLMRIGLRSMIDWEAHGFSIAAEASNGKEALEIAMTIKPDVMITDVKMPIMDGLSLIREAAKKVRGCKFIILSNFDDFQYVKEALQLGAKDYLIKTEIREDTLAELLLKLKEEMDATGGWEATSAADLYSQNLPLLKENLFKDLFGGFWNERELLARAEPLGIRLKSADLVALKLVIDQFEAVKAKYVEKDEKLLRFSVSNIINEIVPSRWNHELIVDNSAEYILLMNVSAGEEAEIRADIEKLGKHIAGTMKDYMNLTISLGCSTVAPGYGYLKLAHQEAEIAANHRFFRGRGSFIFFADVAREPTRDRADSVLNAQLSLELRLALESRNDMRWRAFLDNLRRRMEEARIGEKAIRDTYMQLMEQLHAHLQHDSGRASQPELRSPYEVLLKAETWDELDEWIYEYACAYFQVDATPSESYVDKAMDMIMQYYAEDISLQGVASQINVNPSYLSRIFKQATGENFIGALTKVRIENAKHLLESKSYRVFEVADRVGYHNYTYFSKVFKKVVGVSPEEYRNSRGIKP